MTSDSFTGQARLQYSQGSPGSTRRCLVPITVLCLILMPSSDRSRSWVSHLHLSSLPANSISMQDQATLLSPTCNEGSLSLEKGTTRTCLSMRWYSSSSLKLTSSSESSHISKASSQVLAECDSLIRGFLKSQYLLSFSLQPFNRLGGTCRRNENDLDTWLYLLYV